MFDHRFRYATFECCPAIYNDYEAWVLFEDDVWRTIHLAEILFNAGTLSEDGFRSAYGKLPPLPAGAFR